MNQNNLSLFQRLKNYFSDKSSLVTIVFVLGGVVLTMLSMEDGRVEAQEIGNIMTLLVAFSAFLSIQMSNFSINRKLQIEQQPMVVIAATLNEEVEPQRIPSSLMVKNIGRGPALGVRVSINRFKERTIFDSSQPRSLDLAAGEAFVEWKLDEMLVEELLGGKDQLSLFTSFSDLLGEVSEMRTDMQLDGGYWRVVENKRIM